MSVRGWAVLAALAVAWAFPAGAVESAEEHFDRGYAAYEAGRWDEAAEAFGDAAAVGVHDARVEYNLANSEFRRGRLGAAVLHWERAQRLAPGDGDIAANLQLARERLVDRVEVPGPGPIVDAVRGAQDALGPDAHAVALLVLGWACAGVLSWCLRRPGAWTPAWGWTLSVLLLVAIVTGWSLASTLDRIEGGSGAIVMAPALEVLAGPSQANATVFRIHEGTRVEVRESRGDWIQVVLPNGLTGWVPRDAVEPI